MKSSDHVLVLTAPLGTLNEDIVAPLAKELAHDPHWLSPATACEFPLSELSALARARQQLQGKRVDVNAVALHHRRKKLLVADMDSTIINCECIDEMADLAGLKPQISAVTEKAMRGEIPFESALRERVALLAGMKETDLERVFHDRIMLNQGARTLIATMSAHGAYCALVSGGFTFFTSRVAKSAGFDHHQANELLIADGTLTGKVREPILGREAKREALIELAKQKSVSLDQTLTIGDGANDLAMMQASGLGIAYRAKPVVAEAAHARLDHSDLSAVLFIQGFRETELTLA